MEAQNSHFFYFLRPSDAKEKENVILFHGKQFHGNKLVCPKCPETSEAQN